MKLFSRYSHALLHLICLYIFFYYMSVHRQIWWKCSIMYPQHYNHWYNSPYMIHFTFLCPWWINPRDAVRLLDWFLRLVSGVKPKMLVNNHGCIYAFRKWTVDNMWSFCFVATWGHVRPIHDHDMWHFRYVFRHFRCFFHLNCTVFWWNNYKAILD